MNLEGIALVALGIGLIGVAIEAETSARRGNPGLTARTLNSLGLGSDDRPTTEIGRTAHRLETAFELLTGIVAVLCGVALL